jgi:hypothetical protein
MCAVLLKVLKHGLTDNNCQKQPDIEGHGNQHQQVSNADLMSML